MKIAIVGAPDSVEKIYGVLSEKYKDVTFTPFSQEKIEDMVKVAMDIEKDFDGIYVTGIAVYSALISVKTLEKPVVFTKRGATGLIKSFWDFRKDFPEQNFLENLKLGIDVIEENIFLETLEEFNIDIDSYFHQEYDFFRDENEYLKDYLERYERREINCIFTAYGYIYSSLKEKKIPVYRVQATNSEIKETFNLLKSKIKIKNAEKSKLTVEIIKFSKNEGILSNSFSDKIEFEKSLLAYSNEIEGNIQILKDDEYQILSNKELIINDESLRVLNKIVKRLSDKGYLIAIGIGEGNTISQAEANARKALTLSLKEEKGNPYFSDGEKIKGPLLCENELEYKNTSNRELNEISKKIGVSPLYLEKIKSISKRQRRITFTSKEIADFLEISERSANRVIKKIVENGYGEEALLESLGVGRPRRKISFTYVNEI